MNPTSSTFLVRCVRRLVASRTAAAVLIAVTVSAPASHAEPIAVINELRMKACAREPAAGTRLLPDLRLNDAARELSRNYELEMALERAGYAAARSTSFHVGGSKEETVLRRILAKQFCGSINDPRYEQVGVYARDDETWIVIAARRAPAPPLEAAVVAERVLALVNSARAEGRRCGRKRYEATEPLTLSARLNEAALSHARDIATQGTVSHRGSDGSNSGERIRRAGYAWRASGENVAAGQRDAEAVVADWLASPGHCATLMGPQYVETGVAFALAPSTELGIYWTQVFASPSRSGH